METWQRDHIRNHFPELVHSTYCSTALVSHLYAKGVLKMEDVDELYSARSEFEKTRKFYTILESREGSFDALKNALHQTDQTGALEILNKGNRRSSSSSSSRTPNSSTTSLKTHGTISYDRSSLLGRGSFNTKVFTGQFENRNVAVKVMSVEDTDVNQAREEVRFLMKLDWHKNIVRYFKMEVTEDFILIALERCDSNLNDFVKSGGKIQSKKVQISEVEILRQVTEGILQLHSLKIAHRDLKPANILMFCPEQGKPSVKLTDFGMSKKLPDGKSCFSVHPSAFGTEGWMAPEIAKAFFVEDETVENEITNEMGLALDIFSLGCIYYFALTGGAHPFGSPGRRQINIIDEKMVLTEDKMKAVPTSERRGFIWLIRQMLDHEESKRPPSTTLLNYPTFWSSRKKSEFLQDSLPVIEKYAMVLDKASQLVADEVMDTQWISFTPPIVQEFLHTKNVDGTKFSHLLKTVIDMQKHCDVLPRKVKEAIGSTPVEIFHCCETSFPFLIPTLWTVLNSNVKELERTAMADYLNVEETFNFRLVGRRKYTFPVPGMHEI